MVLNFNDSPSSLVLPGDEALELWQALARIYLTVIKKLPKTLCTGMSVRQLLTICNTISVAQKDSINLFIYLSIFFSMVVIPCFQLHLPRNDRSAKKILSSTKNLLSTFQTACHPCNESQPKRLNTPTSSPTGCFFFRRHCPSRRAISIADAHRSPPPCIETQTTHAIRNYRASPFLS